MAHSLHTKRGAASSLRVWTCSSVLSGSGRPLVGAVEPEEHHVGAEQTADVEPDHDVARVEGVKGAASKATGKPKDDMTFQELEDRLNAAGIAAQRAAACSSPTSGQGGQKTGSLFLRNGRRGNLAC